jgi:hypothetical protein
MLHNQYFDPGSEVTICKSFYSLFDCVSTIWLPLRFIHHVEWIVIILSERDYEQNVA